MKKTISKKEPKVKKTKKVIYSQMDILVRLQKPSKKLVLNTILRYQHGPLASIFNPSEIEALAQDTALEVARRVMLWNHNKKTKGAVDPRGCEAYFSRAFINQCQKMYEKYAKTDIRAGIQTVSSDEALAVASTKNLEYPEDKYILKKELDSLFKELKNVDERVNFLVKEQASREGRQPKNEEFQYSFIILSKTLEGYEASEIREMIGLNEVDYARHRRSALELAKEKMGSSLADLMEHFDTATDYRLLTKEVKKRKKSKNKARNYACNKNFYVQSAVTGDGKWVSTLYVRLDLMDGEDAEKAVKPELIKLLEIHHSIEDSNDVRQKLWDHSKNPETIESINYLAEEIVNKIVNKKIA